MSDNQNNGKIVNVKRVRKDTDTKGREKVVLTFGLDKEGNNGLDSLIAALEELRGKQANFDIRLEEKTSGSGAKFLSAFVLVKEMVPKDQGQSTYVPKNTSRATAAKASAERARSQLK